MAVVDEYGGTLPKIGAAVRVPDAPPPPDVPNAYANFTPTASPGSVGPLAATRSTVPTREEFSTLVQGTPEYKAAMEGVDLYGKQQQSTIDFQTLQQQQQNQLAQQQLGAYDPIYAGQDAMRRERAAQSLAYQQGTAGMERAAGERSFEQQQKYAREALGSRGNAGGQLGFELGNLQFSYDQFVQRHGLDENNAQFAYDLLLRDIELGQQQRQIGTTLEQQRLDLSNQQIDATKTYQQGNLALDISQKKGEALLAVQAQLVQWWWDPATGVYRGPGAATMTVEQAAATLPDVHPLPGPVQDAWSAAQDTAIATGDPTFYMPSPGNVELDTRPVAAVGTNTATSVPAWQRQLAAKSAALNKLYGLG